MNRGRRLAQQCAQLKCTKKCEKAENNEIHWNGKLHGDRFVCSKFHIFTVAHTNTQSFYNFGKYLLLPYVCSCEQFFNVPQNDKHTHTHTKNSAQNQMKKRNEQTKQTEGKKSMTWQIVFLCENYNVVCFFLLTFWCCSFFSRAYYYTLKYIMCCTLSCERKKQTYAARVRASGWGIT